MSTQQEKAMCLIATEFFYEEHYPKRERHSPFGLAEIARADVASLTLSNEWAARRLCVWRDDLLLKWSEQEAQRPFVWNIFWRKLAIACEACGALAVCAFCYRKAANGLLSSADYLRAVQMDRLISYAINRRCADLFLVSGLQSKARKPLQVE